MRTLAVLFMALGITVGYGEIYITFTVLMLVSHHLMNITEEQ